jgi:hypothetical protein
MAIHAIQRSDSRNSMDANSDVDALLSAGRGWPAVLMLVPKEPSSFEFESLSNHTTMKVIHVDSK